MPHSRPFNRSLLAFLRHPLSPFAGYAAVIAAIVVVAVVRAALITDILPYLLFVPVILIGSVLIGRGAGLIGTIVAALFAGHALSAVNNPLVLTPSQWSAQVLFVLVGFSIVLIGAELRRSVAELEGLSEARREALEKLEREAGLRNRLATLVEQSQDFIGYTDLTGRVQFLNEAGRKLIGLTNDSTQTDVSEYLFGEDQTLLTAEIMPKVMATGFWTGEIQFQNLSTGEVIPVRYNMFPLIDEGKTPIGFGTVSTDLRSEKAAERQRETLTKELAHRMKNTLAMVQAVVTQSLRHATNLQEASALTTARIQALGRAQDMLTATDWSASNITDVVEASIAPHLDGGHRFRVGGPFVEVSAQQALGLALAIHELATNATKYGALSNETGIISISWQVSPDRMFQFDWIEEGGPPVVAPARQGFGSRLTERVVPSYFSGRAMLDYPVKGATFHLEGTL